MLFQSIIRNTLRYQNSNLLAGIETKWNSEFDATGRIPSYNNEYL